MSKKLRNILVALALGLGLIVGVISGPAILAKDSEQTRIAKQVRFYESIAVATDGSSTLAFNMRDYSTIDLYFDLTFLAAPAQTLTLKLQHRCGGSGNWGDGTTFATSIVTDTTTVTAAVANPCEETRVYATLVGTPAVTITVRGLGK